MNVYMVKGDYDGCHYVRQYLPQLLNGWRGDYLALGTEKSDEMKFMDQKNSDIIVYHRPTDPKKLQHALLMKSLGKKIVYDNDDTYINAGGVLTKFEANILEGLNKNLYKFIIEAADLITVSTNKLAEEYKEFGKPIAILPNCIYPLHYPEPLKNDTDKIRIGLVGSVAYAYDWQHIKELLIEIDSNPKYQLVLFAFIKPGEETELNKNIIKVHQEEYDFFKSLKNLEWHSWVETDAYLDTLNELKLDIMLMPRAQNYFNECKSNLKFLEASMLKIPCICQKFASNNGPYDNLGKYVILCDDENDFREALIKLENKKLRLSLAEKAYKYVLKNYNIENNYLNWEKTYETIINK